MTQFFGIVWVPGFHKPSSINAITDKTYLLIILRDRERERMNTYEKLVMYNEKLDKGS